MSGFVTAIVVGGAATAYAGRQGRKGAEAGAAATERTAAAAEALNRERYAEAQELLTPSIERADTASQQLMVEMGLAEGDPGTAYMQTPGYQNVMDESLRASAQSATSSGSTTYGGRRLEAAGQVGAGVQQSYYTNYMNMLQNIGQPQVAQNLASLGVGQGATIGQQNIAATGQAQNLRMQGIGAQNAAIADLMGGAANIYSGALAGGYI